MRRYIVGSLPKFESCAYLTKRVPGAAPCTRLAFECAMPLAKALRADYVVYRVDRVVAAAEKARELGYELLTLEILEALIPESEYEIEHLRHYFASEPPKPRGGRYVFNPVVGAENTSLAALLSVGAERYVIDARDTNFDRSVLWSVASALERRGEVWLAVDRVDDAYGRVEIVFGEGARYGAVERVVRDKRILYGARPGTVFTYRSRGRGRPPELEVERRNLEFFEEGRGYVARERAPEPIDFFSMMMRGLGNEMREVAEAALAVLLSQGGMSEREFFDSIAPQLGEKTIVEGEAPKASVELLRRMILFGFVETRWAGGGRFIDPTARAQRWYVAAKEGGLREAEQGEA